MSLRIACLATLCLTTLGCPSDDDASTDSGNDGGSGTTTAATSTSEASTGGAVGSCVEAQTEEACAAAGANVSPGAGQCAWVTAHVVELDPSSAECVFSEPQGMCLDAAPGDTDCEGNMSDCGLSTWIAPGDPTRIIVSSSGLACGSALPSGFVECDPSAGVIDVECECGCAPNLPQ